MAAKSTRIPEPPATPQAKTAEPEKNSPPATDHESSIEERIRQRAHELYLQRGGQHGAHEQDWLQAEKEIRGERSSPATRL
jgi:hypothetical protein